MSDSPRVALVTGASSGIGRATALALAEAGFTVVASARRAEAVADLAPCGIAGVALDVTDDASMQAAVASVLADHGRLDLLVNNAGYALAGPIETLSMEDVRNQFETNVFGLIRMCQLVLPNMRQRGAGRIVNLSSVGGLLTLPAEGAYHATKYAVEAISDALRVEVGQFGVDVVLIEPTGATTPFMGKLEESIPTEADGPYANLLAGYRRSFGAWTRPGNPGLVTPEGVARTIVRAATAAKPRARYKVGWSAQAMHTVRRLLPDPAWDAAMRRALGVAGPRRVGGNDRRGAAATPAAPPQPPA